MAVYEVKSFDGGISSFEDRGIKGAFKFGANLNIRKIKDTLSCNQALIDEGVTIDSASPSVSPSSSRSPSSSISPSPSPSISPSASVSPSPKSPSASLSPSSSLSPSVSLSPSASVSMSSSVSPSPSPSSGLKTVFSDLIIKFVKCSDGKVYGFGKMGYIYKRDNGYWIQVYDAHERITGAEEKPSYGGKIYLEWAGLTTLHRKEIPGKSDWNDVDVAGSVQGDTWPKTNLNSQEWHTMANVSGDVMIANGSWLAMSAYDDSYTNEALDIIPGNIIKTVVERNGRAVLGTCKAGDPNKGVNGAIDSEVPLSQVGTDGQIFYADFTNSMAVKRFPGGGRVNPNGVCNQIDPVQFFDWETNALSWIDKQTVGNLALFGIFDADEGKGGVYSYGRQDKEHSFVMNLEYQLDVDEIGAICVIDGITLVSYQDGSDFGVLATDVNNKATAIYEGLDFKAPVKKAEQITTWTLAEIFMNPLPSGASVQFWYKIDKTGAFIQAKTADGLDAYTKALGKKATFRIVADGQIFEPRIVLIPSGNNDPEVHRLRVYFV